MDRLGSKPVADQQFLGRSQGNSQGRVEIGNRN